ncbi:uncharacterized protein LOC106159887 [Lingula anatina]|uniref:Uncharacterized protein LOC106159887 n=1 Tax=Lingula anatina TaxID=7574 RepID=A0A1S3I0J3_LINAN|nr:uncharacterized protein LOC106159887 [Lingula anatina]|eukprot:XP_013391782.1 uncharacterized protein LOC106159887 [Lingula anatina]
METMNSLTRVLIVATLVILLGLFGRCRPQHWRPQGRFGKRMDTHKVQTYYQKVLPASQPSRYPASFTDSSGDGDDPPILLIGEGTLCLKVDMEGNYRCISTKRRMRNYYRTH